MATATLSSNGFVFINPIVAELSVPSPLIFVQHDMQLSGTLTLLGESELLVI